MILFLEQIKVIILALFIIYLLLYYFKSISKECKYIVKEEKMPDYITDNIEISSDSDREDSDEENSNDEN